MASGFSTYYGTTGPTSGAGRATVAAVVSQSVNETARTVTVTVRAMASYYRTGDDWSLTSGTTIYGSTTSGGYISATVNGSTQKTSSSSIGIQAAKAFTAQKGNSYTVSTGYVKARSGYVAEVSKSYTYTYNDAGDAITGSWSAAIYLPYLGTTVGKLSGSFTTDAISASYSAPSGAAMQYNSSTWKSVNSTTTITDWGGQTGTLESCILTGEYNGAADSVTTYSGVARYSYKNTTSALTATFEQNESNYTAIYSGTPISLIGLTHYKLLAYASNTAGSNWVVEDVLRYLPPAPGSIAYSYNDVKEVYTVTYTGVAANNQTTYDTANLTRTVRYRNSESDAWTYEIQDVATEVSVVTSVEIAPAYGETATVEAWMTYHGMQSEVSTVSIKNADDQTNLYGSVNNVSKKIVKLYGPVDGTSKEITRLYASVNGVARLIYKKSE